VSRDQLRITEIFYSLQGETNTVGLPTVFVRLTGCPLRCQYCDTAYAFKGGELIAIDDILEQVAHHGARYVTVTGGEPLAQRAGCLQLLERLCDAGYIVNIETSGAISVEGVDPRVVKVVDFKTPGSKECERNDFGIVDFLDEKDQVKFVICDRADYDWSIEIIRKYRLKEHCEVLFSPSYEELAARQLADWIIEDKLQVRMQVQLHKVLWGDEPGR